MAARGHPFELQVIFEELGLTKWQRLEIRPVFRSWSKVEYQIMQEETPEQSDGSTRFAFKHKVFSVEGCYFAADNKGEKPKFLMPMGEEMAAIALGSLRQEFGIAEDSSDGKLLDIVAKSLKYVQEIRPNDSIPQELLDGSASWSVEERHRVTAHARIKIQLATLLTGREDQVIQADQIEQLVDDPEIKRRVQEAFSVVAENWGSRQTKSRRSSTRSSSSDTSCPSSRDSASVSP